MGYDATVMPPRCQDIRLQNPPMAHPSTANPSTSMGLEQRSINRHLEGQRARLLKAVASQPGEWDAENFLVNLGVHSEVDVLYVGTMEAGDEGWCWAVTCTGGDQGWLPVDIPEKLPALDLM